MEYPVSVLDSPSLLFLGENQVKCQVDTCVQNSGERAGLGME